VKAHYFIPVLVIRLGYPFRRSGDGNGNAGATAAKIATQKPEERAPPVTNLLVQCDRLYACLMRLGT
jgi:hypothetical protein